MLQSLTQNHTAFGGGKVSDLSNKSDSVFVVNVSTQVGTDIVKAEVEKESVSINQAIVTSKWCRDLHRVVQSMLSMTQDASGGK